MVYKGVLITGFFPCEKGLCKQSAWVLTRASPRMGAHAHCPNKP